MASGVTHAPGVPLEYYERIFEAEQRHWWYRGMRTIGQALLGERLRPDIRVLDAGCGTGGWLRWAIDEASVSAAAGVDLAAAALEFARRRVPEADLRVAPLAELPFADEAFDVVVSHDVLQHVPEDEVARSLAELRRVLSPAGTLLVRTNGAARLRRERRDWRAYDRATLGRELADAGFEIERITYANLLLSLWGLIRRRSPRAPSGDRHGIPVHDPPRVQATVGYRLLAVEARYLRQRRRTIPYGHNLFALALRGR